MGFAISSSNHVVLLPSLILIIMLVWERWRRQRVWLTLLILLTAFLVPFWLHVRVIAGAPQIYSELLAILPPIATIAGLFWMRWWAFRSPRTWFDQIGDRK
jgi:TctA family transporter